MSVPFSVFKFRYTDSFLFFQTAFHQQAYSAKKTSLATSDGVMSPAYRAYTNKSPLHPSKKNMIWRKRINLVYVSFAFRHALTDDIGQYFSGFSN